MLAGCSSTVLSPRHRFRGEASPAQFQATCHFQLPSTMSTQRLDLPCSFPSRSQSSVRPHPPVFSIQVGDSGRSLKQTIRLPPSPATSTQWEIKREHRHHHQFWKQEEEEEKGKRRKRRLVVDESCIGERVKRKKDSFEGSDEGLDFVGQLDSTGNLWFHHHQQEGFAAHHQQYQAPPPPFSLTCSGGDGEEERRARRMCILPCGEVISPCPLPPLLNNPWVGSAVAEITEFSEKDGETDPASSGSSSSSYGGHIYGVTEHAATTTLDYEHGNGSRPRNPGSGQGATNPATTTTTTYNGGDHGQEEEEERRGFELVSLLVGCIESISARNIGAISHSIARLGETASPRGGSPLTRLIAYFTETLALRVTRMWPHVFHITLPRELERADDDTANALRLLNQVCPIPKFIHFTANEMLLRAFEGKERVHIIDFDIKQGLQWPGFFQSLAARGNPPSHVRITGIGESKQDLIETGKQLHGFAEALNLPFEFHPVVDRLEDVRLWMLHVKERESVAVNCIFQFHKLLYDPNGGAFRDFMGLIRSTNPIAVVMAEQEAEHNDMNLERRVCNSLRYYSAIFDLIHSSLPLDSATRVKLEEMFAREIRNMVACEGRDRFERHESFGKWSRRLMDGAGFRCMGVSQREMLQSQMLLKMYDSEGYNVEKKQESEGCEGVTLRWLDQPLYTVSAWTPNGDIAGSSSSFSQPS